MHPLNAHDTMPVLRYVDTRLDENGKIFVRIPAEIYTRIAENKDGRENGETWLDTGAYGSIRDDGSMQLNQTGITGTYKEDTEQLMRLGNIIESKCHYVSFVPLRSADPRQQVALLFPNSDHFGHPQYEITPLDGCFCPRNPEELGKCLKGCLQAVNRDTAGKYGRISTFLIPTTAFSQKDQSNLL